MITQAELKKILDRQDNPESPVLSLYLDIDPSWEKGSHRKFEVAFKSLIQSLEKEVEPKKIEDFRRDVSRAWNFISNYKPSGRGLVLFSDDSEDFFWAKGLKMDVPSQIHWRQKPCVLPLLEIFDEYECYGVILADKKRARIFTYFLSEIETEADATAWNDVNSIRTTGKDNLRSAFKLQRTAKMHAQWHLKHVAVLMSEMDFHRKFDRLILGGSKGAVDELYEWLSPELQVKVAGRLMLPVDVPKNELEQALAKLEIQIERRHEEELVQKLIQADPPENHRILGLDPTLAALNNGRVHTLIYSENFHPNGNGTNRLEEMARAVIQKGGSIEEVRGNAARLLDRAGGIGAILKQKERNRRLK